MRLPIAAALLAATFATGLTACTWVHMAPGASAVRVVSAAPANCQNRGEVEVSVKERLGPYERNTLRVRDELETLARNEAPGLGDLPAVRWRGHRAAAGRLRGRQPALHRLALRRLNRDRVRARW